MRSAKTNASVGASSASNPQQQKSSGSSPIATSTSPAKATAAVPPPTSNPSAQDAEGEDMYEEVEEEYEEEYEEEEEEEEYEEEEEEEEEDEEEYEDEEEEYTSTDDEEDEEQETILTYSTFPVPALRGQHFMVVCAFVKHLVIGTNEGTIALVDASTGATVRQLAHHMDPISDVSCDSNEDFVAAADKAGVISVQNLYDANDFFRREFDCPMQSIALHPKHSKSEDRPIICAGGDKVFLITRTMFLGNRKTTIIQERRGKVYTVRWCGDLVAWANDRGITIYNYTSKSVVHSVAPPSETPRPELYRCSLFWESPQSLLCGWGDWVQSFTVSELRLEERIRWGNDFSRTHKVEVGKCFRTSVVEAPYRLCGLAPLGPDMLFILACIVETNQEGLMRDLEVRVVDRQTFNDVYRGRLNVSHKHPLQFGLTAFINRVLVDSTYYVVSVDSIIKAIPCDDDDHIEHLLRVGKYQEAFDFAQGGSELHRHDQRSVGNQLLEYLVNKKGLVEEAAQKLPDILEDRAADWERWISIFDKKEQSHLLIDVLPVPKGKRAAAAFAGQSSKSNAVVQQPASSPGAAASSSPTGIRPEFYELVLTRCLERNVQKFQAAVKRLEGLYDPEKISSVVEVKFRNWKRQYARQISLGIRPAQPDAGQSAAAKSSSTTNSGTASGSGDIVGEEDLTALGDSLGLLLRFQGKDEEALSVLLTVQDSEELFTLIQAKKLFSKALQLLPELFAKSQESTLRLLLEHCRSGSGGEDADDLDGDEDGSTNDDSPRGGIGGVGVGRKVRGDPLSPESVVHRLESGHRKYLWMYLRAIHDKDNMTYSKVAKRHAQLMATLLVEFDAPALLPFLRENSMHLQNMKEIMALCQTYQLVEEMSFLMARMGKEEEGLRILVQDVKSVRKAIQFVLDIPHEEDQIELFKKLVQYVIDTELKLSGKPGKRYLTRNIRDTDSWSSIAKQYDVDEDELKARNAPSLAGAASAAKPPNPCIIPIDMLSALLSTVADPVVNANSIIDPVYVIKKLPASEPINNAGRYVSGIARSRHAQQAFMETVVRVSGRDIAISQDELHIKRVRAIRLNPAVYSCPYCTQLISGDSSGCITFRCGHAYHPKCIVEYLTLKGVLRDGIEGKDIVRAVRDPRRFLKDAPKQSSDDTPASNKTYLTCYVCGVLSDRHGGDREN